VKKTLRNKLLFIVFIVLAVAVTPSAFAYGRDGGGGACQVCAGTYDPASRTAVVNCADADNNQWGSNSCNVICGVTRGPGEDQEYGSCNCDDTHDMCLMIVVTSN